MKKEILLFLGSIGISILATLFFGEMLNDYLFPGSGGLGFSSDVVNFVNSFPLFYDFFVPFIFIVWGGKIAWRWILGAMAPEALSSLLVSPGSDALLWAAVFFAVGVILAYLIRFLSLGFTKD